MDKIFFVFNNYDGDGSGEIEEDEFRELIQVITGGAEMQEKKLKDLWLSLDVDHSGEVNFEEFLTW